MERGRQGRGAILIDGNSFSGLIFGSFQFTHHFKYMVSVCVFDIWSYRDASQNYVISAVYPKYVDLTVPRQYLPWADRRQELLVQVICWFNSSTDYSFEKHNKNAQTGNRLLFHYRQIKTPNAPFKESVASKCSNCCTWNYDMIHLQWKHHLACGN